MHPPFPLRPVHTTRHYLLLVGRPRLPLSHKSQELKKRDFSSLARYYDGRDDLAGYTLDTELRRMKYSVVAEDGRCLEGAGAAARKAEGPGEEEGEEEAAGGWRRQEAAVDGGGGRGSAETEGATGESAIRQFLSGRRDDPMLRMANQSIFADMLEVRAQPRPLRSMLSGCARCGGSAAYVVVGVVCSQCPRLAPPILPWKTISHCRAGLVVCTLRSQCCEPYAST